jgi:hypothetical protein
MVQNLFPMFFGPLSTVSGTVSSLRETTHVSGNFSHGRGQVRSSTQTNFRIGRQPATMWSTIPVVDADVVTAAGTDAGGSFTILALRNETTGYEYQQAHSMVIAVIAVVLSISLLQILIGFLMLPIALLGVWHSRRVTEAAGLLRQTQVAAIGPGGDNIPL